MPAAKSLALGVLPMAILWAAGAHGSRAEPPIQQAAPTLRIAATPACRACRIRVGEPIRSFGAERGLEEPPFAVALNRSGTLYATLTNRGALAWAIDPGKPPLPIGKEGGGPGEFRMVRGLLLDPADTLYLFDPGAGRISVLDQARRFVRSFPAPVATFSMAWLAGPEQLLLNASVPDRDRIGLPFHTIGRAGSALRSFGPPDVIVTPDRPYAAVRRQMQALDGDRFLAVTVEDRYEIESWSAGRGRLLARFVREAPWMGQQPQSRPDGLPPPSPSLHAIWARSADSVWVIGQVPDRRWATAVTATPVGQRPHREWRIVAQDFARYFDTVIEVIDLRAARVVAATRIDPSCRWLTPARELICDGQNADGSYRLDLRPMELQQ